jgi:hypothetical protein
MYLLSETILEGEQEKYALVAIGALDLLTLYDRLLDVIGWFARDSLLTHPERETNRLTLCSFRNARDGERGALFVKLANHLEVPGDRSNFVNVYKRVGRVRNYIAHASDMVAMTKNGQAGIAITYYKNDEGRLGDLDNNSWVSKGLLTRRCREAEGLLLHVDWCREHLGQRGGFYALHAGGPKQAPAARP